jgi:hypothetical protein
VVLQHRALEWHELVGAGFGLSSQIGDLFVSALTTQPNGDVVAGGQFTTAGSVTAFLHRALEWHELVGAGFGIPLWTCGPVQP